MTSAEIRQRVESLMAEHGLTADGWTFAWSRTTTVIADTEDGVVRTIRFSRIRAVTMTPDEVDQVALHEIAHALVGCARMHDEVWTAKADRKSVV